MSNEFEPFVDTLCAMGIHDDIQRICREHGISNLNELRSETRTRHVTHARHQAMAYMHARFPYMSYPALGRVFGRDPTTVLAAVRKIKKSTLRIAT